jgi:hypothetical protein
MYSIAAEDVGAALSRRDPSELITNSSLNNLLEWLEWGKVRTKYGMSHVLVRRKESELCLRLTEE